MIDFLEFKHSTWVLDSGCWILGAGCWVLGWVLFAIRHSLLAAGTR